MLFISYTDVMVNNFHSFYFPHAQADAQYTGNDGWIIDKWPL